MTATLGSGDGANIYFADGIRKRKMSCYCEVAVGSHICGTSQTEIVAAINAGLKAGTTGMNTPLPDALKKLNISS